MNWDVIFMNKFAARVLFSLRRLFLPLPEGGMRKTRSERRRVCWESVFPRGVIEGLCPICSSSLIKYSAPCGNTFQKLHIIPKSQGGSDESWNLLPGCGCNQNMSSMNLVDWMGTKGNRASQMKPLFLSKYKSLVSPLYRSPSSHEQLLEWIEEIYEPRFIEEYKDWLVLSQNELLDIGALYSQEEIKSPYFCQEGEKGKRLTLSGKTIY